MFKRVQGVFRFPNDPDVLAERLWKKFSASEVIPKCVISTIRGTSALVPWESLSRY